MAGIRWVEMADLFAPQTKASAAVNTARALMLQLALFHATREQSVKQETPSPDAEQPAQSNGREFFAGRDIMPRKVPKDPSTESAYGNH